MLFNSYEFIFLFLPPVLLLFRFFRERSKEILLVTASLFFYAFWHFNDFFLLMFSLVVNYFWGTTLMVRKDKRLLVAGLVFNLGILAYFKYANFFLSSLAILFGKTHTPLDIVLPLAISFFTFQKIAFGIDCYRGLIRGLSFTRYLLFVCFFPQLIAGPIVLLQDVLPQFQDKKTFRWDWDMAARGANIFLMGLSKKMLLADPLAKIADPVFIDAGKNLPIDLLNAWGGILGYTFQLYFDFSGYSDMAIGLALFFGIRISLNFHSPYKAKNIIDFWRRWHMTLGHFLREYLYIPLGGNLKGHFHQSRNLFLTMLLGGLWHGAGWNFVFWGGLHGFYLMVNHWWRRKGIFPLPSFFSHALTFLAVMVGWVFFRSENLKASFALLKGMVGGNGILLNNKYVEKWKTLAPLLSDWGVTFTDASAFRTRWLAWIAVAFILAFFFPNTQEIMRENKNPQRVYHAFAGSLLFCWCVLSLAQKSEFIYFQF